MENLNLAGVGTVIPPEARAPRPLPESVDYGYQKVAIENIEANEADDCVFVVTKFGDGLIKHLQVFLPMTSDNVQHAIMAAFKNIYGKDVLPAGILKTDKLVGQTILFTEA